MTGNELANLIRKTKGKIAVQVIYPNHAYTMWVYAEKADLERMIRNNKDNETGLRLDEELDGCWYLTEE